MMIQFRCTAALLVNDSICLALCWENAQACKIISCWCAQPQEVMCGGDINFLAVQTQFGGLVVGAPQASGIDRNAFKYRGIYQRTGLVLLWLLSHNRVSGNLPIESRYAPGCCSFWKDDFLNAWKPTARIRRAQGIFHKNLNRTWHSRILEALR